MGELVSTGIQGRVGFCIVIDQCSHTEHLAYVEHLGSTGAVGLHMEMVKPNRKSQY